jgi:hypothetical protein
MAKKRTKVEKNPQVKMYSDEFGFEEFAYDSIEEAEAGFGRLQKDCTRAYNSDGIERRVFLVLAEWTTGDGFDS